MNRIILDPTFDAMNIPSVKAYMRMRAAAALQIYRHAELEYDSPDYPFGRHDDQQSIRDSSSTHFRDIRNGVSIVSDAPASSYIEYGNAPGGVDGARIRATGGNRLWIKARNAGVSGNQTGRFREGADGRMYFVLDSVASYKGRDLLRNSIKKAFGAI